MSREISVDNLVREDLKQLFDYIAQDSPAYAVRFLAAAEAAFEQLSAMPEMGRAREFQVERLAGIRSWSIPGFRDHLIFYRPIENGIQVIRVLHGARDIERIFEEEAEEQE